MPLPLCWGPADLCSDRHDVINDVCAEVLGWRTTAHACWQWAIAVSHPARKGKGWRRAEICTAQQTAGNVSARSCISRVQHSVKSKILITDKPRQEGLHSAAQQPQPGECAQRIGRFQHFNEHHPNNKWHAGDCTGPTQCRTANSSQGVCAQCALGVSSTAGTTL